MTTLWGIGVGPGDKSLITFKAVETINGCSIIAAPKSGGEENVALNIAYEFIKDKNIVELPMPMTRDLELLNKSHEEAADTICRYLDQGEDVGFLTLGDPSIYSSYMYLHKIVGNRGYNTKLIPGVTSFCAAAASLNISLCEREELLHIIPASYKNLDESLDLKGTKILMKSGKEIKNVIAKLKERNMLEKAMLVERCGMTGERVVKNLEEVDDLTSYFSIIVVKESII